MRPIKLVVAMIVLGGFLLAQTDPSGRVGRLNYVSGAVSLQPAGLTDWVEADVNRPLTTGDQVWVGVGGRAEIHAGSTALRLNSNTAFQFLNLDDQTIQIQLSQGILTVRIRNLAQGQHVELDTPNLAFTALRPGEYRVDADPDSGTTTVSVWNGDGEVTGGGLTFPVRQGQRAIVIGSDQITYNLVPVPRADAWDQWSSSRDRREDQSPSARYVSREMNGYEDLDQYGRWGNQPGYGQVWMPNSVGADWAPYHDGHWAWITPWGWTWVDEAPWGFAPYHYGRWSNFGGRWGWIPGPYGVTPTYAPALVGWIGGGSGFSVSFAFGNAVAVGWFPLGPREPYFPAYGVSSRYFGRVNSSNTVINSTTINHYYNDSRSPNSSVFGNLRYANRDVRNAVTAVPQDRFANGRRVAESGRAVSDAQLRGARFLAAPAIAPQRVSVLGPRAGEASRVGRPPVNVLSRPVVARSAPPPAAPPFERQQTELNRNPGRPLPTETIHQIRQSAPARIAPVKVVDMGHVQHVQPTVGAGPQAGSRPSNSNGGGSDKVQGQSPNGVRQPATAPTPVGNGRPNDSPVNGQMRQYGRETAPVGRSGAPAPNGVRQPDLAAPGGNNRQGEPPANGPGKQNGREATPAARPAAPVPNVSPRPQNSPQPNGARQPDRQGEPPVNGPARQNGRNATPAARPPAPVPNVSPRQQNSPQPNGVRQPDRQGAPPVNGQGRQNGREATPAARPSTPVPNVSPRQQNSPQPDGVRQPDRQGAPPMHGQGRQNGREATPAAMPSTPVPNVSPRQPNSGRQPEPGSPRGNNRQGEPSANAQGRQNERSAPVARPDAPAPNVRTSPQPNAALPPAANNRQSGPPASQPQPRQPAAPPAQNPQRQPLLQMSQRPAEKAQPASQPKDARGKPEKNDEKK